MSGIPSERVVVNCTWCDIQFKLTVHRYNKSTTKRFFCPKTDHKHRWMQELLRTHDEPCANPDCGNRAKPPSVYCSRACRQFVEGKSKTLLQCGVEGCDEGRWYYPSQIPKSGQYFCPQHSIKRNTTGRPPGDRERRYCELGDRCLFKDSDGTPAWFDEPPKSTRQFCSHECASLAKTQKISLVCEWKGWFGDEEHTFEVPPSTLKYSAGRFCTKTHEQFSRIKRPLLDRPFHNGVPKRMDDRGYVFIYEPDHHKAATFKGWIPEAWKVAEETAGRLLMPGEDVHHMNDIKDDNRPENLKILSHEDHAKVTSGEVWKNQRRANALAVEVEELKKKIQELEEGTTS